MATAPQDPPRLVEKLKRKRTRYRERGRVYRVLWIAAGLTLLLAGLVMVVLPGPALVVIPAGLAMLSFEFRWAQRLLDRSLTRGVDAKDALKRAPTRAKAAGAAGVALAAGAVAALVAALAL